MYVSADAKHVPVEETWTANSDVGGGIYAPNLTFTFQRGTSLNKCHGAVISNRSVLLIARDGLDGPM